MRVLLIESEKPPRAAEVDNTLEAMQQVVGGYIQAIYPFREEVAIVCNDEGKLLGLPPNRALRDNSGRIYDVIAGTFFICAVSTDGEGFAGLTEGQMERYSQIFQQPEMFLRIDGKLVCIPFDE